MSVKKSVQFKSIPLILEYYREYELPCWSIMHDKVTIFRYDGDDLIEGEEKLKHKLNLLKHEGSAGIYQLSISDEKEQLTCGFRMNDYAENYIPGLSGGMPAYNEILSKLNAMEAQIKDLKEQQEEDDEDDADAMGQVAQWLENPVIQSLLLGVINKPSGPQPAINGVEVNAATQAEKINEALYILKKYDTHLGDHLLKLARLAENNPPKFKNLLMLLSFM